MAETTQASPLTGKTEISQNDRLRLIGLFESFGKSSPSGYGLQSLAEKGAEIVGEIDRITGERNHRFTASYMWDSRRDEKYSTAVDALIEALGLKVRELDERNNAG